MSGRLRPLGFGDAMEGGERRRQEKEKDKRGAVALTRDEANLDCRY
jgi:hypothetical protein